MFHNFAVVIEPEDVDPGPIAFPWPFCMHVHDHVIALSDHPHDMRPLSRIRLRHADKVLNERLLPICHARIMLNVQLPDLPRDCFGGLTLVEHQIIELQHGFFVPLQLICHQSSLRNHETRVKQEWHLVRFSAPRRWTPNRDRGGPHDLTPMHIKLSTSGAPMAL